MNIEEGKTYTPEEWREVQTQLIPGDEYEAVNRVEVKTGGNLISGFHKVTVTHLAPRIDPKVEAVARALVKYTYTQGMARYIAQQVIAAMEEAE